MKPFALIVDGKSVETVRHREVRNPATGDVVGLMPLATVADLDMAVRAATNAFESWKSVPGAERADACRRIAAAIEHNSEELAKLLTLEQGKPLNGLGSRFEIGGAVAWTRYTAELELPVEVLQDSPEGPGRAASQADRRSRFDHAMELAGDDRLLAHHSGRPRRQHRRHQAVAEHATVDDPPGRDHQRSAAAGGRQRDHLRKRCRLLRCLAIRALPR